MEYPTFGGTLSGASPRERAELEASMADFEEEFDSDDETITKSVTAPPPPPPAPLMFSNDGSFLAMMQAQLGNAQETFDDGAAMKSMGLPSAMGQVAKPAGAIKVEKKKEPLPPGAILAHTLNVEQEGVHEGTPLAKYVSNMLPALAWSRNKAANAAKEGMVRVNNEVSGANRKLAGGDVVEVYIPKPCTLKDEEIVYIINKRQEAKIARDFVKAAKPMTSTL